MSKPPGGCQGSCCPQGGPGGGGECTCCCFASYGGPFGYCDIFCPGQDSPGVITLEGAGFSNEACSGCESIFNGSYELACSCDDCLSNFGCTWRYVESLSTCSGGDCDLDTLLVEFCISSVGFGTPFPGEYWAHVQALIRLRGSGGDQILVDGTDTFMVLEDHTGGLCWNLSDLDGLVLPASMGESVDCVGNCSGAIDATLTVGVSGACGPSNRCHCTGTGETDGHGNTC